MDQVGTSVEAVGEWVVGHPLLILLLAYIGFVIRQRMKPWPVVPGSKVVSIETLKQWNDVVAQTSLQNRLLVVDFYATWCPPCKAAAGPYAEMSKQLDENKICFAKVDVDKAKDVARLNSITAMPTFKLFKDGSEIASQRGWSLSGVKGMIEAEYDKIK